MPPPIEYPGSRFVRRMDGLDNRSIIRKILQQWVTERLIDSTTIAGISNPLVANEPNSTESHGSDHISTSRDEDDLRMAIEMSLEISVDEEETEDSQLQRAIEMSMEGSPDEDSMPQGETDEERDLMMAIEMSLERDENPDMVLEVSEETDLQNTLRMMSSERDRDLHGALQASTAGRSGKEESEEDPELTKAIQMSMEGCTDDLLNVDQDVSQMDPRQQTITCHEVSSAVDDLSDAETITPGMLDEDRIVSDHEAREMSSLRAVWRRNCRLARQWRDAEAQATEASAREHNYENTLQNGDIWVLQQDFRCSRGQPNYIEEALALRTRIIIEKEISHANDDYSKDIWHDRATMIV